MDALVGFVPEIVIAVVGGLVGWILDRQRKKLEAELTGETKKLQASLDRKTNELNTALQEEVATRQRHEQRGDLANDVAIDELGNIAGSLAKIAGRVGDLPEGCTFTISIPPELQGVVIVE